MRIDKVTLGVTDLDSALAFYRRGFGFPADGSDSILELREWDALAGDAGVSPESRGFRGFTLSYIVAGSSDVDDMLARLVGAGGRIVKEPRFAFWGYSGHVADPSGHLWKIASPKRRSLLGRRRDGDGVPALVPAQELALTVGVAEMKRAKEFYADGLGSRTKKDYSRFVSFDGGDGTPDLSMYKWDALADDAGVPPEGRGFRGFTMSHSAGSASAIDEHLDRAVRAGAQVLRRTSDFAYFADVDGYLWKIAA